MKKSEKMNILFIMSDDQGAWAMGCAGNDEVKTPNLDNLANSGVRFENFFCVSPVCSPARASVLTGKIPSQHGIHDWISKGHANEDEVDDSLREKFYQNDVEWQYEWSKSELKGSHAIDYLKGHTCFTELLKDEGYYCGISGKWHLGNSKKPQGGFEFWRTIALGGDNYYYPVVLDGDKFVMKEGTYITDYITDNALQFLDIAEDKDQPFYLSVHYTAPHAPWDKKHHPDEFYSMYDDCEFKATPDEPTHEWAGGPGDRQEEKKKRVNNLRGYYAAMSAMDDGIGKILKTLEDKNMLDNTLVVFTSDNGMSMGHHGIFGKGNGTFPLNMYDTAVKVPMIVSYPKCLDKGIVNEDLLSHYDIFPTIVDALDLDYTTDELPGKSFLPRLLDKEQSGDDAVVVYDEYGATRMIRTKEHKYIHRYPYGPHEFYDLTCDPDEKNNEVDNEKYQDIIISMRKSLNDWFYKYADPKVDGSHEAVKGRGQIELAGVYSLGKKSFKQK